MKICTYCGTECEDSIRNCPSCGANKFENICAKCGTKFSSAFCPSCGTKAGTEPKTCKNCGTVFFSKACPECGFIEIKPKNVTYTEMPENDEADCENETGNEETASNSFFDRCFSAVSVFFILIFIITFVSGIIAFFDMFFSGFW